jgi:hypothetical protein
MKRSEVNDPLAKIPSEGPWYDRPMRWAQLTFVENDPETFDLNFWLDFFKRINADAACISTGGYIAYHPTDIPLHYRSKYLGDKDIFGDLVKGCRDLGMVVITRTDPHAVHQDIYEAHPDWIAVDAEGNKRQHWAMPGAWVTCALGPMNFEFMTQVNNEIVTNYAVDGIFSNRWAGSGMCYCEHCQQNFREAYGMDLPRTTDPQDPARKNFIIWRQERLFELCRLWDSEIRKINPNACYIPNSGGGALSDLDMKTLGEFSELLFADKQARSGLTVPWASGKNAKEYRATLGKKPIGGIFSVGIEEPYRWKDSVQNDAEIRVWVADATANGMRPWFTKFRAEIEDKRWLRTIEDMYIRLARWERYLRNKAPVARVALVYSQQTAAFYGRDTAGKLVKEPAATFFGGQNARKKVEHPISGFYHALIEARIPFEMVHDKLLDAEHLDGFKTLILPNIAAMSDAQCEQLCQFVKRGGSIVATFETSLYDEWGERRENFGLADLFGVNVAGDTEGPMKNSYLRLEHNQVSDAQRVILSGLEDASRIINGVHRVPVEAHLDFPNPPVTFISPYPDLPMEEVYPREGPTGIPEVYLRELGESRVAYIPWDIDRTFWEILSTDHGKLLRNVVQWATNEQAPVTVSGPGVLDVTVWRQKDSMTVHLVNLTNPMMMKGPFRELIPVGAQHIRVRLPEGKRVTAVKLLAQEIRPEITTSPGVLELTVPTVLDHEIVAIDFE